MTGLCVHNSLYVMLLVSLMFEANNAVAHEHSCNNKGISINLSNGEMISIEVLPLKTSWVKKHEKNLAGKSPFESEPHFISELGIMVLIGPSPFIDDERQFNLLDFFSSKESQTLEVIRLDFTDYGDDVLQKIGSLPHIRELCAGGTAISDKGLKFLEKSNSLKTLQLNDTGVTDIGMKHLAHINSLEELYIGGTKITGEAFSAIAGLPKLRVLYAQQTNIGDAGLKALTKSNSLKILSVAESKITNAGVRDISAMQNLHTLDLGCTEVSDVAIPELQKCQNLEIVYVDHTRITPQGISQLAAMKSMKAIFAYGIQIHKSTLDDLRQEYPNVVIVSDTQHTDSEIRGLDLVAPFRSGKRIK